MNIGNNQHSLLGKLAEIVRWFRVIAGKPVEGQNVGSRRRRRIRRMVVVVMLMMMMIRRVRTRTARRETVD